jgi:hypothetical protein
MVTGGPFSTEDEDALPSFEELTGPDRTPRTRLTRPATVSASTRAAPPTAARPPPI